MTPRPASSLRFVDRFCESHAADVDPRRVCLLGFSDGATVGVELATSRRFAAVVCAAYGFTGDLPAAALDRLRDVPFWMIHSEDDEVFAPRCSERFVAALRAASSRPGDVKLSKPRGLDHVGTALAASSAPATYEWLLGLASG